MSLFQSYTKLNYPRNIPETLILASPDPMNLSSEVLPKDGSKFGQLADKRQNIGKKIVHSRWRYGRFDPAILTIGELHIGTNLPFREGSQKDKCHCCGCNEK
jgi:hypothetical protein